MNHVIRHEHCSIDGTCAFGQSRDRVHLSGIRPIDLVSVDLVAEIRHRTQLYTISAGETERFVALSIANANVALTHPVTSLSGFSHFNAIFVAKSFMSKDTIN
ncbi:hypothetical protein EMCRGX_G014384 [Ephydatia muelleri]